jgi:MarR family transcriptional regulator, transcriptional regulator for hemolysin
VRPRGTPIGLQLARSAKVVGRAFADTLAEAGGSLPMFLALSNLMGGERPTQQQLARALEIEGPTLTRHLDAFERAGLVTRAPHETDRRASRVEITEAGRAKHAELLAAVIAFNKRLHAGFTPQAVEELRASLARLEQNARADRR